MPILSVGTGSLAGSFSFRLAVKYNLKYCYVYHQAKQRARGKCISRISHPVGCWSSAHIHFLCELGRCIIFKGAWTERPQIHFSVYTQYSLFWKNNNMIRSCKRYWNVSWFLMHTMGALYGCNAKTSQPQLFMVMQPRDTPGSILSELTLLGFKYIQ